MPPCSMLRRASLFDLASPARATRSTSATPSDSPSTAIVGISPARISKTCGWTSGCSSPNRIADAASTPESTSAPCTSAVAAADLERALALAKQVQEVVGLEQHVAELGERQPRIESRLHRLLLQHDVHGEVLADVAQEVDHALLDQPLGIVQQQCGRGTGAEFQKPRGLVAHAMHVLADFFLG